MHLFSIVWPSLIFFLLSPSICAVCWHYAVEYTAYQFRSMTYHNKWIFKTKIKNWFFFGSKSNFDFHNLFLYTKFIHTVRFFSLVSHPADYTHVIAFDELHHRLCQQTFKIIRFYFVHTFVLYQNHNMWYW